MDGEDCDWETVWREMRFKVGEKTEKGEQSCGTGTGVVGCNGSECNMD